MMFGWKGWLKSQAATGLDLLTADLRLGQVQSRPSAHARQQYKVPLISTPPAGHSLRTMPQAGHATSIFP
jgi:hypothetical protein